MYTQPDDDDGHTDRVLKVYGFFDAPVGFVLIYLPLPKGK